ncbi:hypothetical protein CP556_03360 [Natrinema sp. CBA1119]|uniref:hypothetical protein n=1 Tax=Natrinema sp. CBA1119 TaxID=1608465 RepID=UPI000BFA353D|nr:hypothetical protein [Natrinema sp. CBA1119]PGF15259.1 hypothetical protein CP556_03360 [Natrinema sp. CBA1119]
MTWAVTATFGLCSIGAGAFIYVLVANLEPQPEYPELMTDLLRLLGLAIAVAALGIGLVFLVAAGSAYTW